MTGCGVAQAVLGRCLGSQYAPVLRKLLKAADTLPIGADDLYTAASAHGSLADVLQLLGMQHPDTEVHLHAKMLGTPWAARLVPLQTRRT